MFIIVHNITELKAIENKLSESEERFRSYFENSPLSLLDEDYSDVISYLNKPLDTQELERAILIARARFNDIRELKEKNMQLEEADKLNKNLMKEIHHRVKNNFQLISSLLNLQIGGIGDEETRRILEAGRDRVRTLAVLHEKLYEAGDFVSLPMNTFIKDLMNALSGAYNTEVKSISMDINIDNIVLDSKKALTIGLVLNEAVTNSIKYAFPVPSNKRCTISVSMAARDKSILLRITDNGIGVSDIEKLKSGNSLGIQLIQLLSESQLEGSIEFPETEGTEILIRFRP